MKMKELKILPKYFNDILFSRKRFELRKNDKDFKENDIVILREYDNIKKKFTCFSENTITVKITYVLKNVEKYGLDKDYCIFGFEILFLEKYHLLQSIRS